MSGETKKTDQDQQTPDTAQLMADNTSEAPADDAAQEVNKDKESSCCGCCS